MNEQQKHLLKSMITIRKFEEVIKDLHRAGLVDGALHCYTGEEAIAAGVCDVILPGDYVFSTHRGHGHAIAMGCELDRLFAELMGRADGVSGGMGGSMHLFDVKRGLMGGNGIVGGGLSLSLGTAYAEKLRGSSRITICFFSEGASNEGWFHETMNMAALWKLPLVFVCENNLFAATTPSFKTLANPEITRRAIGYGMPGVEADGNDVDAVRKTADEAAARARSGQGPTLVEYKTYRVEGHCMVIKDLPVFRPAEEVKRWAEHDPIRIYSDRILRMGDADEKDLAQIFDGVGKEISSAVEYAKTCAYPDAGEFLNKIKDRYAV